MEATADTARMVSTCRSCKTPHAEDVAVRELSGFFYLTSVSGGGHTPHRACRNCGRGLYRWERVNGRLNAAVKCTARCTAARGHDCECSCAGKNHGADNLGMIG